MPETLPDTKLDRRRTVDGPLSTEERAALLAKHEAMVWMIAHKVHKRNPACDVEDLASEVRLGFVQAARKFNPALGLKFNTYAYKSGRRRAVGLAAAECARGVHVPENRGFISHPTQTFSFLADEVHDQPQLQDRAPAPVFTPGFWDEVTVALTPGQKAEVLLYYRDGLTLAQIGKRLGKTKEAVRQRLLRAVREMYLFALGQGFTMEDFAA